jgi:putative ABC transport system permease protein
MKPRWRKVLADLWGNLARFLLVTLSLTVGLLSVGMIAGGYVTILQDMSRGYQSINPADFRIMTGDFDENLLERITRLDGVTAADGERLFYVQVLSSEGDWKNLILQVIPEDGQQVDQLELIEGEMPGEREIVLDIHRDIGLSTGDQATIILPSGVQKELPISGVVRDQTIGVSGTSYFVAPIHGYVLFDSLPWLEQPQSYSTILVRVDPELSEEEVTQLRDKISGLVKESGLALYSITDLRPTSHPNSGYITAMSGLLALLGFLSVFLSGFLVFNAMTALFSQQIQYIGIMKAIGAQRKDIIRMYMVFIFSFGLLALAIAIPTAAVAWAELGEFLAARLNYPAGGLRTVPLAVILQVVIALILPQAAGILPILRASNVSVQKAITTTGIEVGDFGKGWMGRQLEKIKGLGRPLMISLRNTFRRKGRLVLTLITLSLGGAVFIANFNVRVSLDTYIDNVSKYLLADVSLEFDRNYRINEIEALALRVPGVADIEPRGGASCQLLDEQGEPAESVEMVGAPPESELIQPILIKGRWIIPGDQNAIVLNEAFLSRYPDLQVGETITLQVNRREVDWQVVGFFQFIGSDYFLVYVPLTYLNQVTGNNNQAANFQIVADSTTLQNGQMENLTRRLDHTFRAMGYDVRSASTSEDLLGNATLGLDTLTVFLLIMSGLTALVGSISLTGTMGMNVLERTREIGVMRAIGATDRQVMKLVIIEGGIIGLLSWFFAVLLAFPISFWMSYIINSAVFGLASEFTYSLTVSGFLIWLGIVIVLSVVASFLPARNAARLTIREVLSYE